MNLLYLYHSTNILFEVSIYPNKVILLNSRTFISFPHLSQVIQDVMNDLKYNKHFTWYLYKQNTLYLINYLEIGNVVLGLTLVNNDFLTDNPLIND